MLKDKLRAEFAESLKIQETQFKEKALHRIKELFPDKEPRISVFSSNPIKQFCATITLDDLVFRIRNSYSNALCIVFTCPKCQHETQYPFISIPELQAIIYYYSHNPHTCYAED